MPGIDTHIRTRQSDYESYLASDHWQQKRKQALARAHDCCQICNSPEYLNVHHRTYERLGNERPEDLTVLCRSCHQIFHASGRLVNEPIFYEVRYRFLVTGCHVYWNDYDELCAYWTCRISSSSASIPGFIPRFDVTVKRHANGTPMGGSTYRAIVERVLGRKVQRLESVTPEQLIGQQFEVGIRHCLNRDWEPRWLWREE
jgi:hypothetical protein